ncbi:MAG TPA: SWIM zinc finger family protein, partial [Gemmataceae bacterium]|nr:SWIM zinc finger family protein [Gemmataceae bacterium]
MAGEDSLLAQIHTALLHFDDDALAALANKGLVRRARKDLETVTPLVVGPAEGCLRVQIDDCTIDLAVSPAQSKCTCPATGVCRHILAAILFVRDQAAAQAP